MQQNNSLKLQKLFPIIFHSKIMVWGIVNILFSVNGMWSAWGEYSTCTKTCGTGQKSRTRTCTNPAPSGGGSTCPGSTSEMTDCNISSCPGKWF